MYTGVNVSSSNSIKDGEYAAKRTINVGRHYDAAISTIFRKDEKGNRHEMNEYLA